MADQHTVITPSGAMNAEDQERVCDDERKQEGTDSNQQPPQELDSAQPKPESDKAEETEPSRVTNVENVSSASHSEAEKEEEEEDDDDDDDDDTADPEKKKTTTEQQLLEETGVDGADERGSGTNDSLTGRGSSSDGLPVIKDTNTEAGQNIQRSTDKLLAPEKKKDIHVHKKSPETLKAQETRGDDKAAQQRDDEDEDEDEIDVVDTVDAMMRSEDTGGNVKMGIVCVLVVLLAAVVAKHIHTEPLSEKKGVLQIDNFLRQLDKVKTRFPSQRSELWRRSRIHLERHLLTAQPTEPVSLILTAGLSAEKTLHCLAKGLASSFSSAINASVLHIDGAAKASQDSDQVKLDIDSQLQAAFEGDKPVAVIHRFEELPPGSTLIFYRYCDHENAAYKKTFLIFTVLLEGEVELPIQLGLSAVEEMVDDHLKKKFLSYGHPVAFDRMDLDKYGGLWSRISHLILPVAAEERLEHEGEHCNG
ncbi:torsin-1A-interacting protein 2-like isoform X2 [Genypterus blacodes]|uniref:torsin-1A-interacting protein 2-like isoform X2 n=1 Tax=Genypterus blacodes TaxID=154954 RepID=UPI003F75B28B